MSEPFDLRHALRLIEDVRQQLERSPYAIVVGPDVMNALRAYPAAHTRTANTAPTVDLLVTGIRIESFDDVPPRDGVVFHTAEALSVYLNARRECAEAPWLAEIVAEKGLHAVALTMAQAMMTMRHPDYRPSPIFADPRP